MLGDWLIICRYDRGTSGRQAEGQSPVFWEHQGLLQNQNSKTPCSKQKCTGQSRVLLSEKLCLGGDTGDSAVPLGRPIITRAPEAQWQLAFISVVPLHHRGTSEGPKTLCYHREINKAYF